MAHLVNFSGDLIDFFQQSMRGGNAQAICPSCGYEFQNYMNTGLLGCSKCYDVFRDPIMKQVNQWSK